MPIPFDLWGERGWATLDIVSESHFAENIRAVLGREFKPQGSEKTVRVRLGPEPNRFDRNAIGVWAGRQQLGHLTRDDAARYSGVLSALVAQGWIPQAPARVWAAEWSASVRLDLAEPHLLVPANHPPPDPHRVLPPGPALPVTGEEGALLPWLRPEGESWVHVTLHEHPDRAPHLAIEVRIDGVRVGSLSPRTSSELLPAVRHLTGHGVLPAARAIVRGNTQRAETILYAVGDLPAGWLTAAVAHAPPRAPAAPPEAEEVPTEDPPTIVQPMPAGPSEWRPAPPEPPTLVQSLPTAHPTANQPTEAGPSPLVQPSQGGPGLLVQPSQGGPGSLVQPSQAGPGSLVQPSQAGPSPLVQPTQAGPSRLVQPSQVGPNSLFQPTQEGLRPLVQPPQGGPPAIIEPLPAGSPLIQPASVQAGSAGPATWPSPADFRSGPPAEFRPGPPGDFRSAPPAGGRSAPVAGIRASPGAEPRGVPTAPPAMIKPPVTAAPRVAESGPRGPGAEPPRAADDVPLVAGPGYGSAGSGSAGHDEIPPRPSGIRFVVPSAWPQPPAGWSPPPGWRPDPAWPDPPPGWQWWVPYWD